MLTHRSSILLSLLLALLAVRGFGAEPAAPARAPGWLGVSIQEVGEALAEELAKRFGVEAGTGVLVMEALKGGPAEAAGIHSGDVIVGLGGHPIWEVRQLQQKVRALSVGKVVEVAILRERERLKVLVKVGPMPEEAQAQLIGEPLGLFIRVPSFGKGPREVHELGAKGSELPQEGVVVAFVEAGSPADRAGLQPRDVILAIDGVEVASLKAYLEALRGASSERHLALTVLREGSRLDLLLHPQGR